MAPMASVNRQLEAATSTLAIYNYTCTSVCPDKFLENPILQVAQCVSCSSPCENCKSTATNCTLCQLGKLMYQGMCLDLCPLGITIINNNTRSCDVCVSTCFECVNSVRRCTSCVNGYFLLNSLCYNLCPAPYLPDITERTCSTCKSPCRTCEVLVTNCTSCSVNYYFEFKCVTTCNGSYYADRTLM